VATYFGQPSSRDADGQFAWLAVSLAVTSLVELAVLRTFTRVAIHIPALHAMQSPYRAVSVGGRFTYFLALVLAVAALGALASVLLRGRLPGRQLALAGLLAFVLAASLAAVKVIGQLTTDSITVASVLALSGAVCVSARHSPARVPMVLYAGAFGFSCSYTLIGLLSAQGSGISQPDWLLTATEICGVAFALASPLLTAGIRSRRVVWPTVAVGGLVLVTFLGNASTSHILLLWNAGLSGTLPTAIYALAAGALAFALLSMLAERRYVTAAGLVLLVTGGIGLHNTYQSALVIVGLGALAWGLVVAETTNPVVGLRRDSLRSPRAE
jgi:hypothetical protein